MVLSASVQKGVSSNGEMTIDFSDSISPLNLTLIDSKVIQLKVMPIDDTKEASVFNLIWEPLKQTKTSLTLKI